jgi:hypothetical protein
MVSLSTQVVAKHKNFKQLIAKYNDLFEEILRALTTEPTASLIPSPTAPVRASPTAPDEKKISCQKKVKISRILTSDSGSNAASDSAGNVLGHISDGSLNRTADLSCDLVNLASCICFQVIDEFVSRSLKFRVKRQIDNEINKFLLSLTASKK